MLQQMEGRNMLHGVYDWQLDHGLAAACVIE